MECHPEDVMAAVVRELHNAGLGITIRDTTRQDASRGIAQNRNASSQGVMATVSSGAQTCSPPDRSRSHTLFIRNKNQHCPARMEPRSPPASLTRCPDIHRLEEQLEELRARMYAHGCNSHAQSYSNAPSDLRATNSPKPSPSAPIRRPSPPDTPVRTLSPSDVPNRCPSPSDMPNRRLSPPGMPVRCRNPSDMSARGSSPAEMPTRPQSSSGMPITHQNTSYVPLRIQSPSGMPSSPAETRRQNTCDVPMPSATQMPMGSPKTPEMAARCSSPQQIPTRQPRPPLQDVNFIEGIHSSSNYRCHRPNHRDLRTKEAFAESLRKSPDPTERTLSVDIVQRSISHTQHKSGLKKTMSTKRVYSLTRHTPDPGHRRSNKNMQTRLRDEHGRPKMRRVTSLAKSDKSNESLNGRDGRRRSFSPRSIDVRYLSDMTRYVRDTLRQVCLNENFQGTCPQLMDRYYEHRRQHHQAEASTLTIGEHDQASCSKHHMQHIRRFSGTNTTIDCRGNRSPSISNSVRLKMIDLKQRLCQICNQPRPCHCDLPPPCPCPENRPTTLKDRFKNISLCSELRRLYSQEPIYEACSCPQDVEDEVNEAVDKWVKFVPIYAGYTSKEKIERDKLVADLKTNLKLHVGNKTSSLRDIVTCMQELPMWLPLETVEQAKLKEKLANDLLVMVMKIDIFDSRVKRWVETLPFSTDIRIDKDTVTENIIRKFKDIAMTTRDLRTDIINGALDELENLPITVCSCLEKENIAKRLADAISSLSPEVVDSLKYMDDYSTVRKQLELEDKIVSWVNGVPVETSANIDREAITNALTTEVHDIVEQTDPDGLWYAIKLAANKKLVKMSVQGGNTEQEIQATKLADSLTSDLFGAIVAKWAKNVAFDHNSNVARDHFAFELTKKLQASIENVEPEEAEEHMKVVICDVLNSMPASGSLSLKSAQAGKLANDLNKLGSKENCKIKEIVKKMIETLPIESSQSSIRKVVNNLVKNIKHTINTVVPQDIWLAVKQDALADIESLEVTCNDAKKEKYAEKLGDEIVDYLFDDLIQSWLREVPFKLGVESYANELSKVIKNKVQEKGNLEDIDLASDFIKSSVNEALPDELLECSKAEKEKLIDGLIEIIKKSPKTRDKITMNIEHWIKKSVPLSSPMNQEKINNFVKNLKNKLASSEPKDAWKTVKEITLEQLENLKLEADFLPTKLEALAEELASIVASDEFEAIVKDWSNKLPFNPNFDTVPDSFGTELSNKLKYTIGDRDLDLVHDILQNMIINELNEAKVMYNIEEKNRESEKLLDELKKIRTERDYILIQVEMWLPTVPFSPDVPVNKFRFTKDLVGHLKHKLQSGKPEGAWYRIKDVTKNELSRLNIIGGPPKVESLAESLANLILLGMQNNIIREWVETLPFDENTKVNKTEIIQDLTKKSKFILGSHDQQVSNKLKEAILDKLESIPIVCTVGQKSDLAIELVEKLVAVPKEPDQFNETLREWVDTFPFETNSPVDREKFCAKLAQNFKNIAANLEPDAIRDAIRDETLKAFSEITAKCDETEKYKLFNSLADKLVFDMFGDAVRKWINQIPLHPEPIVDKKEVTQRLTIKLRPKFNLDVPDKSDVINTIYNDIVKLPIDSGTNLKDVYLKELAQDLFNRLSKLPPQETEDRKRKKAPRQSFAINVTDWLKGVTAALEPKDRDKIIKTTLDKLRKLRSEEVDETEIKKELQNDIEKSVNELLAGKNTASSAIQHLAKKLCNEVFDTFKIVGDERRKELTPKYKQVIQEWLLENQEIDIDKSARDKFSLELAEKIAANAIGAGTKTNITEKNMQLISRTLNTVNGKFKTDSNLKNTLTEKLIQKLDTITDFVHKEKHSIKNENIYRMEAIQTCLSRSKLENQLSKKNCLDNNIFDQKYKSAMKKNKYLNGHTKDDTDLVENLLNSFNQNKKNRKLDEIDDKHRQSDAKSMKILKNEVLEQLSISNLSNEYETEHYVTKLIKKCVAEKIHNLGFSKNKIGSDSYDSTSNSISTSEEYFESNQQKKIKKHVTNWIKSIPGLFDKSPNVKIKIKKLTEALTKKLIKIDARNLHKRETKKKLRNTILSRLNDVLECNGERLDSETELMLSNQLVNKIIKYGPYTENNSYTDIYQKNYKVSSPNNIKQEIKKNKNEIPELSCSTFAKEKQMRGIPKAPTKEFSTIGIQKLYNEEISRTILKKTKDKLDSGLEIVGQRLNDKAEFKALNKLLDRIYTPNSALGCVIEPEDRRKLQTSVLKETDEWKENDFPEHTLRTIKDIFFTTRVIASVVNSLTSLQSQCLDDEYIRAEIMSKVCDKLDFIFGNSFLANDINKLAYDLSEKIIMTLRQLHSASQENSISFEDDISQDSGDNNVETSNKERVKNTTINETVEKSNAKINKKPLVLTKQYFCTRNIIKKWFHEIQELQATNSHDKRKVQKWLGELRRKLVFLLSQNLDNADLRNKMAKHIHRILELASKTKNVSLDSNTTERLTDRLIEQLREKVDACCDESIISVTDIAFNTRRPNLLHASENIINSKLPKNEESKTVQNSTNNLRFESLNHLKDFFLHKKPMRQFNLCSSKVFYVENSTDHECQETKISKEIDPATQDKIFSLIAHNIDAVDTAEEKEILKIQIKRILLKDVELPEEEAQMLTESILKYAEDQAQNAAVDQKNLLALLRQEIRKILADYPIDTKNKDAVEAFLMDVEVGRLFEGKSYDDVKGDILQLLKKKGGLSHQDAIEMLGKLGGDFHNVTSSHSAMKLYGSKTSTRTKSSVDMSLNEKTLENVIKHWLGDLNIDSKAFNDEKPEKEIIQNLTGYILDREKYLQQHPEFKTSEAQERYLLETKCHEWIQTFLNGDDMNIATSKLDELIDDIRSVLQNGDKEDYLDAFQNEMIEWQSHLPPNIKPVVDDQTMKKCVKDLADTVSAFKDQPDSEEKIRAAIRKMLPVMYGDLSEDEMKRLESSLFNSLTKKGLRDDSKYPKQSKEEYLDALQNEMIEWQSDLPPNIKPVVDDQTMKKCVKGLADTVSALKDQPDSEEKIRAAIRKMLPVMYGDLSEDEMNRLESSLFNTLTKKGLADDSYDTGNGDRAEQRKRSSHDLRYTSRLECAIGNWLNNLPINKNVLADEQFRDTIIKDLAGVVVDRNKYLHQNPGVKITEAVERDYIKNKCHIWMKKFLENDDLNTAMSQINNLVKAITSVDVPILVDDTSTSTKYLNKNDASVVENTLQWLKHSPIYLKASPEKRKQMEEAAVKMAKELYIDIVEAKPRSDIDQMLRGTIKNHVNNIFGDPDCINDEVLLNATADNLLHHLKGTKAVQELAGFPKISPLDLLAQAVEEWTNNLPFERQDTRSPQEEQQLNKAKTNLVSRLKQARDQFYPSIPEHEQALRNEARKFLRSSVSDPHKRADERYIEDEVSKLVKILDRVPLEQIDNKKSIKSYKSPADAMFDYIGEWVDNLPVQGEADKPGLIKQNLTNKLIHKIGEINMNPDIFNDDDIYQDSLSDEIDKLLLDVPGNPELNKYLPALKKELISKVLDARQKMLEELAGKLYKQHLRDQISTSLPLPGPLALDEQASLELLKDRVADAFINLYYAGCDEYELYNYKKKISNELNRFCTDILRHYPCANLEANKLKTKLHEALMKVPVPRDDSMKSEVEQVRIRDVINEWMREIPLRKETLMEKLRRYKFVVVLAKNIHNIEMEKQYNDFIDTEPKIREEIKRFMGKIPIREDMEILIPAIVENLLYILFGTEKSRRFISAIQCQSNEAEETCGPFLCVNGNKQKKKEAIRKYLPCKSAILISPLTDSCSQTDHTRTCGQPKSCADFILTNQKSCSAMLQNKDATCMTPFHITPRIVVKEYIWGSSDSCTTSRLQGSCSLGMQTMPPQLESTKKLSSARHKVTIDESTTTEPNSVSTPVKGYQASLSTDSPVISPPYQCLQARPCGRYRPMPCQQLQFPTQTDSYPYHQPNQSAQQSVHSTQTSYPCNQPSQQGLICSPFSSISSSPHSFQRPGCSSEQQVDQRGVQSAPTSHNPSFETPSFSTGHQLTTPSSQIPNLQASCCSSSQQLNQQQAIQTAPLSRIPHSQTPCYSSGHQQGIQTTSLSQIPNSLAPCYSSGQQQRVQTSSQTPPSDGNRTSPCCPYNSFSRHNLPSIDMQASPYDQKSSRPLRQEYQPSQSNLNRQKGSSSWTPYCERELPSKSSKCPYEKEVPYRRPCPADEGSSDEYCSTGPSRYPYCRTTFDSNAMPKRTSDPRKKPRAQRSKSKFDNEAIWDSCWAHKGGKPSECRADKAKGKCTCKARVWVSCKGRGQRYMDMCQACGLGCPHSMMFN